MDNGLAALFFVPLFCWVAIPVGIVSVMTQVVWEYISPPAILGSYSCLSMTKRLQCKHIMEGYLHTK